MIPKDSQTGFARRSLLSKTERVETTDRETGLKYWKDVEISDARWIKRVGTYAGIHKIKLAEFWDLD